MGRECINGREGNDFRKPKSNLVCQFVGPAGEYCKVLSKRQQRTVHVVLLNLNSLEPIKQKTEEGIDCETVGRGGSLSCSVASGNEASNNKLGGFPSVNS